LRDITNLEKLVNKYFKAIFEPDLIRIIEVNGYNVLFVNGIVKVVMAMYMKYIDAIKLRWRSI
jgi:hypothetical protein